MLLLAVCASYRRRTLTGVRDSLAQIFPEPGCIFGFLFFSSFRLKTERETAADSVDSRLANRPAAFGRAPDESETAKVCTIGAVKRTDAALF